MISTNSLQPVFEYLLAGGAIVISIAISWVTFKTNSFHVLGLRVWRLAMGSDAASDGRIRASLEEQTSLSQFAFMYGLKPTSIKDAHAILDWVKAHDINLVTLGRAGRYFDIRQLTIDVKKLPGKARVFFVFLVSLLLLAFAMMSSLSLLIDRPILRFNESKTYFSLSQSSAKAYFKDAKKELSKTDCQSLNGNIDTGFSQEERGQLCALLNDKSANNFVAATLSGQRSAACFLFVVFIAGFFLVATQITAVKSAKNILNIIKKRGVEEAAG
jgi:hypothetical protein